MRPAARRLAAIFLAGASLGALGCASGGLGSTSNRESGTDELRRELTAARQRAVMAEVEVGRLRERLAELEERLATLSAARAAEPIAEPAPIEAAESQPIALPGRSGSGAVEESELEAPPVAPPPPIATLSPASPTAPPAVTNAPAPAETAGAQALYDRGYAFFHQKRYADAEDRFREFLAQFPDHGLADNAQFWIGESRYARGDFSSALAAFSATVEHYPNGNKVADAMLKAGKCLESMGQTSEAIATYEAIEARFPDTVVASTAASRLAALRRR